MNVDKFKNDHATVLSAVEDLKRLVKAGIEANADAISKAVVAMSAKVKLHLASEDQYLYPALAKSANPAVTRLGKQFQDEMGGIAVAYMEFVNRWNLGAKVAAAPEDFRAHANAIFKALHQRIQRENKELYPLAEAA